jgi:hypothetical protein
MFPLVFAWGALVAACAAAAAPDAGQPVSVTVVTRFYDPNQPEVTPHLIEMMKRDPGLKISMWSGLSLPGGGGRAPIIMSIAGKTSPDIMDPWFHVIRNDIEQGFLYR